MIPAPKPWQWSVRVAKLDPVRGSEQAGDRPVLVVSRESINSALPIVGILPLTSYREGRHIYPSEVLLSKGTAGLARASLVLAHQIRVISIDRLGKHLGYLQEEELREKVRQAVRVFLDLEP